MTTKIRSVAKALPAHYRTTEEILPRVEAWLSDEDQRFRDKVLRIFKYAQVDRRYSIMDPEAVFTKTSFADKNAHYAEAMTDLAEEALQKALQKAGLAPEALDYIITVSCTGIMIPSVDAYLINRVGLKQDIIRLPVTEMGCAGGTSALIYAHDLLKAYPERNAAIIALESPTSTFQLDDKSMANMVSAAIFGDGVACAILGPTEDNRPVMRDRAMYHFYDALEMMGFRLTDGGLQMILDPAVPQKIAQHFEPMLEPFLARNSIKLAELEHFIFHPGGKKIVQMVEDLIKPMGKHIDPTKEVLRAYGNMSSATVLYVLEHYLDKVQPKRGERGLMLSFGPGFSAQKLLLQWE